MPINGRALAVTGIGLTFVWSGIKGWSILGTIGDVIAGVPPSAQVTNPVASLGTAGAVAGDATGAVASGASGASGLAAIFMQYQGHPYLYGGAPGPDGSRKWDCSSAVNWIVSVKGGKAIPGYGPGKYRGTTHGPPTGSWAIWPGMQWISRAQVQSGDILVWAGHMGMAINHTQFISALNPTLKTRVGSIDGGVGRGPLIRIGRLR
jgi:cell wall-associated NlpC family hydrolase